MTKKKDESLTKSEAMRLAWKNRKDYKGYDKSRGSKFNTWRAIVYTQKGRKIGFPEEWKSYDRFDADTKEGWEHGKLLCRIDSKKPYSKDNCEWRNKGEEVLTKLKKLCYNGEEKTLVEWCEQFGLNYSGVRQRYFRGKNFTPEQILFGKNKRLKGVVTDIKDIPEESKKRSKAYKMLSQYKLKDNKNGFDYDIDPDWFINEILTGHCHYCGDTERLGLDRIDNSKGHTMDNVVVCCYDCNCARNNNFTYEEMIELGKVIRKIKEKRHENQ